MPKPAFFSWATEILEGLHMAGHPAKLALVLIDDTGRQQLTFLD